MDVRVTARKARTELKKIRGQEPMYPVSPPMKWWHMRYTALICDYMCEEVPDERLLEWPYVFTALHEMVAHGCACFLDDDVWSENQAWSRVSADKVIETNRQISLNPVEYEPEDFIEEYAGFLRYVAKQGVVRSEIARGLAVRFEAIGAEEVDQDGQRAA